MNAEDIAVALEQEVARLRQQMAEALAVVEAELPESCYHAETMEYYDDPCARCVLRSLLTVSEPLTLDVIAARRESAA